MRLQAIFEEVSSEMNSPKDMLIANLNTIIEMVEEDALTEEELMDLANTIGNIAANLEADDEEDFEDEDEEDFEDEDYEDEDEFEEEEELEEAIRKTYLSTFKDFGTFLKHPKLKEIFVDGKKYMTGAIGQDENGRYRVLVGGRKDRKVYEDEFNRYKKLNESEGMLLNKSTGAEKRAAKAYAKSAMGKRVQRIMKMKRKKYASRIHACNSMGKTFSFKSMSCEKKKHRR